MVIVVSSFADRNFSYLYFYLFFIFLSTIIEIRGIVLEVNQICSNQILAVELHSVKPPRNKSQPAPTRILTGVLRHREAEAASFNYRGLHERTHRFGPSSLLLLYIVTRRIFLAFYYLANYFLLYLMKRTSMEWDHQSSSSKTFRTSTPGLGP